MSTERLRYCKLVHGGVRKVQLVQAFHELAEAVVIGIFQYVPVLFAAFVPPNCILIAEDSTNYPGVTKTADSGGLGFDYSFLPGCIYIYRYKALACGNLSSY